MHFDETLILLYFIEMLPRTVSQPVCQNWSLTSVDFKENIILKYN